MSMPLSAFSRVTMQKGCQADGLNRASCSIAQALRALRSEGVPQGYTAANGALKRAAGRKYGPRPALDSPVEDQMRYAGAPCGARDAPPSITISAACMALEWSEARK